MTINQIDENYDLMQKIDASIATGSYEYSEPLRNELRDRWAAKNGFVQARGVRNWHRLHGKLGSNYYHETRLPNDDHVTVWRRPMDRGIKISSWVSQPYHIGMSSMREMLDFADEHDLQFRVGKAPAWHYPRYVFFIEWRAKNDPDPRW